jgi:NTE family protein
LRDRFTTEELPMSGQADAPKPTIALILQGGGALGAYHVGALEAMQDAGYAPDWVAGISIGAFNAAIIAGNPPERRIDRLNTFWEAISRPDAVFEWVREVEPKLANTISYWEAIFLGQPGFFTPRYLNPNLAPPGTPAAISYCDTSPVRATLASVVDFGFLNAGETRISLGATDVESGNLVFFSNKGTQPTTLTAEHVMASGSLPPGFPPVAIDGRQYWDGACVSNTPLQAIYEDQPQGHTIAFVIDLWSAAGRAPQTIDDVTMRQKQIQYATRTDRSIDGIAAKIDLQHALRAQGTPASEATDQAASADPIDFVHIIYHPSADQVANSDVEFSRASIAERRAAGYADMMQAIKMAPWRKAQRPHYLAAAVHRVEHGTVTTHMRTNITKPRT